MQFVLFGETIIIKFFPVFGMEARVDLYYLNLASNEYITAVYIRHGNEVDNLTFVTNFKIFSTGYGTGGTLTVVNFGNAGLQNHGFFGRSGNRVDKLGFYGYTHDKF